MFVSKVNEAVLKMFFVQALLLSPQAYFFVAPSPFLSPRASFFVAPSASEGSLGACAPREDTVGGCHPEPFFCRPEPSGEGSRGTGVPREDRVGGCRLERQRGVPRRLRASGRRWGVDASLMLGKTRKKTLGKTKKWGLGMGARQDGVGDFF